MLELECVQLYGDRLLGDEDVEESCTVVMWRDGDDEETTCETPALYLCPPLCMLFIVYLH